MRLVLDDRAAEAAAELVAAVVLLVGTSLESLSVSVAAFIDLSRNSSKKLPCGVVGAALGDDVHHAAVAAAVFGLGARGDEVELLDRLEREELQQAADGVVVVVAAVDLVVDVAAVAAVDLRRVLRALGRVAVEAEADARNRRREVRELAAVQRQVLDPLDVDDAADRRARRLDQRRLRRDADALGDAAPRSGRC